MSIVSNDCINVTQSCDIDWGRNEKGENYLNAMPIHIFDETYIPIEHGTHEGNLPSDCWDIYRIQESEDIDSLNIFFDEESNKYLVRAFVLQSDSSTSAFSCSHWMIDSGCIDHLSSFIDDFVYLGDQK